VTCFCRRKKKQSLDDNHDWEGTEEKVKVKRPQTVGLEKKGHRGGAITEATET